MKRNTPSRKVMGRWLSTAAATFLICSHAASQKAPEEASTLHVYANLLQIPVLILSGKRQPLPPIEPGKFLLSLGNDPPFHPRVRLEGEDPITLAVLIDGAANGPRLPELGESLAAMARDQLHRQDRMALYGLDGCKLRRFLTLRPSDAETVRAAIKALEAFPPFQHRWHGESCDSPVPLWDSLAWVAQSLQSEPGRRVVLVVTNGEDSGSRLGPGETRAVATRNGVAVFALAERFKVRPDSFAARAAFVGAGTFSALAYIAEGSGGMVMETARNNVAGTLARFPELLRGRYILEFSRPTGIGAGTHLMTVSVGQPKDFIRPAGTSMPVVDPEPADPTVEHGKLGDLREPPPAPEGRESGQPSAPTGHDSVLQEVLPAAASSPTAKTGTETVAPGHKAPAADQLDATGEAQPVGAVPRTP